MALVFDIFVGTEFGEQEPEQDKKKEVIFSNKSESYCISFVDIIGSSQITSNLYNSGKLKNFYTVFINEIADIVKNHSGKILKTVGDGVIFFFPETCMVENEEAFNRAIECLLNMVSCRDAINDKLYKQVLATISYRISADYGKLEVASSGEINSSYDLFGPTLNFCTKINKKAPPNGIAIGGDLWRIVNSFPKLAKRFHFQEVKELTWKENRYSYPVYLLGPEETHSPKKILLSTTIESTKQKINSVPKQMTIMLIDDNPDISLLFGDQLTSAGMIVDTFTNSEDALKHFIKSHYRYYDLVVTDIRMPGLNGFELYQQLKAFNPNIRIIFLTALDISPEMISLLPELKLNQFIRKPVDPITLISSIKQLAKKDT
ncbi:MAG: response regulator [Nitrososphaeraceae archaeon]|nr:response regulator [Nitrososphaeraceae archaeon]